MVPPWPRKLIVRVGHTLGKLSVDPSPRRSRLVSKSVHAEVDLRTDTEVVSGVVPWCLEFEEDLRTGCLWCSITNKYNEIQCVRILLNITSVSIGCVYSNSLVLVSVRLNISPVFYHVRSRLFSNLISTPQVYVSSHFRLFISPYIYVCFDSPTPTRPSYINKSRKIETTDLRF